MAKNKCALCPDGFVLEGKRKYCRVCAGIARAQTRKQLRALRRAEGAPAWRRNGWASEAEFRRYHREDMRRRRALKARAVSSTAENSVAA